MFNVDMSGLVLFDTLLYWQRPRTVFLEVTNTCNLKCITCHHFRDDFRFEKGHMEWDFFERVVSGIDDIRTLCLFASGEPLIAKHWDKMIDFCLKSMDDSQSLGFSTNGMFLNMDKIMPLIGKNVIINVSVDGATPKTFEHIRRGATFNRLIGNLDLLCKLKEEHHTDMPHLQMSFVAWKENIVELPQVAELAARYGAGELNVVHRIFLDEEDFYKDSLVFHEDLFDVYLEKTVKICEKLGVRLVHTGTFSDSIPPTGGLKETFFRETGMGGLTCRITTEQTIICFNGVVRACCYVDRLFMGNLHYDGLNDIWNGPLYRQLRLALNRGQYPDDCKSCSFLQVLKMERRACLSPLNTGSVILSSPPIKQSYSATALDKEFNDAMCNWKGGRLSSDDLISCLLGMWDRDNNLFEVANNIGIMYFLKGIGPDAIDWLNKAARIMPSDDNIKKNCSLLSASP